MALLAVAGATALIAYTGNQATRVDHGQRKQPSVQLGPPIGAWPFVALLAAHIASFLLFSALTIRVVEGGGEAGDDAVGFVIACFLVGALSMVFLLGAAVPFRSWVGLLHRARGVLVFGTLIGLLAWAAGTLSYSVFAPLWRPTLFLVERLLQLTGQEVMFRPADQMVGVVGPRGPFAVIIDPSCSGYQGIGLVAVFLAVYLWIDRHALRMPQALTLLPIGIAAIWLTNVLRIAVLILIGGWVSGPVAMGGFHSQAGWLSFLAISLGLVAVVQRGGFFLVEKRRAESENPTAVYLMPLLSVIGVTMLVQAAGGRPEAAYPLGIVVGGAVLWYYWRGSLAGVWRGIWSARAALLGVVAFLMWVLVKAFLVAEEPQSGIDTALAHSPPFLAASWILIRFAGMILIVPVVEELAFRGFLMRRLIASDFDSVPHGTFTWASFLISSLVFAVVHDQWMAGLPAGMLYALAYCARGRLSDAVLAHVTSNALVAALVLATGRWGLL